MSDSKQQRLGSPTAAIARDDQRPRTDHTYQIPELPPSGGDVWESGRAALARISLAAFVRAARRDRA